MKTLPVGPTNDQLPSLALASCSAPSFDAFWTSFDAFWKDHDGGTVEKEPTAAQSRAHARKHTLNAKLRTLSEWAKNRADNPHHDVSTTISMLRRKVGEIDDAVARASLLPNSRIDGTEK
jgi:hypothetical protein